MNLSGKTDFPEPPIPNNVLEILKGREVLCGFSGGADSTALLLALQVFASKGLFTLKAIHFEHGIRGIESQADANYCKEFCKSLGIAFERIDLAVPSEASDGEGFEAAARRLRLNHWKRLSSDKTAIALGHNANDRAENLFLRLFRGSNATGLSSMRAVQRIDGMLFVRPLLETTRAKIEEFVKKAGLPEWRCDATNNDESYKRNFLRHSIMPTIAKALPYAPDGIAHSLKALEDDASYLEASTQKEWASLKGNPSISAWSELHPAIRVRALRLWLSEKLGSDFIPDSKLIARFNAALPEADSERCLIPLRETDAFLSVSLKGLEILKGESLPDREWDWRKNPEVKWGRFKLEARLLEHAELPKDNWAALFDAKALSETLILGRWREGERMTVMGRKRPELLKELFNKAGISSIARESHPLLRQPTGEVLWIPGVRRSELAAISGSATTVLQLTAKET